MSKNHELWYAEAKRGLDMTTSGFTTVKRTSGLPRKLQRHMEQLSCYDNYSQFKNHVRCCFSKCSDGGDTWYVLSRATAATGYSQRAGFFCHHVAIHQSNRIRCNPASLLNSNLLASKWDGKVEELSSCRPISAIRESADNCATWAKAFGDAGAAGDAIIRAQRNRSVYVPFSDPADALSMAEEALNVLSAEKMWQLTFTTYLTSDLERDACAMKFFPSPAPKHLAIPSKQLFAFNPARFANDAPPEVIAARTGNNMDIILAAQAQAAQSDSGLVPEASIPMAKTPAEVKTDSDKKSRGSGNATARSGRAAVKPIQRSGTAAASAASSSTDSPNIVTRKNTRKESSARGIVAALVGLLLGLGVAAASCVPFIFNYKHKLETELLAKEGLEKQLVVAKQASEKGNENIEDLSGDVKDWRLRFEQETAVRKELEKDNAAIKEQLKDTTESKQAEIDRLKTAAAKKQKELDETKAKLTELETRERNEKNKIRSADKNAEQNSDNDMGKNVAGDNNADKEAEKNEASEPDGVAIIDVEAAQEEVEIPVKGAFGSLRIENWPASRQSNSKRKLGFETVNDGKKMSIYVAAVEVATVFHQFDGKTDNLVLQWNERGLNTATNRNLLNEREIRRRLGRSKIAFKYLDGTEDKETFIRLNFIKKK